MVDNKIYMENHQTHKDICKEFKRFIESIEYCSLDEDWVIYNDAKYFKHFYLKYCPFCGTNISGDGNW